MQGVNCNMFGLCLGHVEGWWVWDSSMTLSKAWAHTIKFFCRPLWNLLVLYSFPTFRCHHFVLVRSGRNIQTVSWWIFYHFFAYRLTFLRAWQNPDPFQIPRRLTWNRDRNHTTEVSWRRSLWFHLQRCQTRWWSHTMQLRLSLSFWQRIHHPSWWKEAPKFNLMFSGDMTTVCRSWKVVLLRTNGKTEKGSDCSTILPLSSLNRPWRDDMRCELLA